MIKENLKTMLIVIGVIIIAIVVLVKIRDVIANNDEVTGAAVTEPESNIKQAAPTPSSCTPGQNCGSPTCAVATGRGGGCGCGG
jgi:hypothetical protein